MTEETPNVPARMENQPVGEITVLGMIERAATNPEVDVEKMNALLDMQERILDKEAESAFNHDLMLLQESLPIISRNGSVEYEDKSGNRVKAFKFATYDNIYKAIQPIMKGHGFSVSFTTESRQGDGGGITVTGRLLHKLGHSRDASIPVALDSSGGKNNIQAMGSSFSYGKRYTLTMLLNIVTEGEDDDANSSEPITEAQLDHLHKLIEETESDTARVCKFAKVDALPEIQQNRYDEIVKTLMDRQKEQRKEQKNENVS